MKTNLPGTRCDQKVTSEPDVPIVNYTECLAHPYSVTLSAIMGEYGTGVPLGLQNR